MSIKSKIFKWLGSVVWPWFEENVWPTIKEHVWELIEFLLVTLKGKIKDYVSKRSEMRETEAAERARDAEKLAESADSQPEREKWEAISAVWREVANTFREENEALNKRIEELTTETNSEAEKALNNVTLDADFSRDKTLLTVDGKVHELSSPESYLLEDNNNSNDRMVGNG